MEIERSSRPRRGGIIMWQYNYNYSDELMHYGRKGQKWGQHIFTTVQEIGGRIKKKLTGSTTDSSKKSSSSSSSTSSSTSSTTKKTKSMKSMTNDELKAATERLQLENAYRNAKNAGKSNSSQSQTKTKEVAPSQQKKKSVQDMTDSELQAKINRLRLEETYNSYMNKQAKQTSAGKEFVKYVTKNVIVPAATDAAVNASKRYFNYLADDFYKTYGKEGYKSGGNKNNKNKNKDKK